MEEWSEHYQRRETAEGKAVGRDSHKGIMILASAMRHSVGRPAMSMEGGHEPMRQGAACRPKRR